MRAEELSIIDAIPHIVWTQTPAGEVLYFNPQWTRFSGLTLEETLARGAASTVHAADLGALQQLFASARDATTEFDASYRLRRKDGQYRWHHARLVPLRREGDTVTRWLGIAVEVHEERELQMQRQYLIDATRVLGADLDLERTLRDVAKVVVPHMADWCAIDLVDDEGSLRKVAVAHVDPSKIELAWELDKRNPARKDAPTGLYPVVRTGQPELTREISDELLVASLPDPELLRIYRELGLRSAMIVPLRARDRIIGALSLVSSENQRLFDDSDLAFASELAARIAVAVDNARLYGEALAARGAAEAIAQEVLEQSQSVEAAMLEMRRERDAALAKRNT
ncbi:MAG TPA: PAS domain-containing protein [Kofleriaceae bacterium]|nr:PAS domain-containing protein [Kofleriaceae bacterium]